MGTETMEQINLRVQNALTELKVLEEEKGLFDKVIVNDDFNEAVKAFYRLMRDWYPALPSASRLRMLQRRVKSVRLLASQKQSNVVTGAFEADDDAMG